MRRLVNVAAGLLVAGASLFAACTTPPHDRGGALPLHTAARDGRMILVDRNGQRVRLRSVNWFGFESSALVAGGLAHQPLSRIVQSIKDGGFNSVRLPWCNEMLAAPAVAPQFLSANPALAGKTPLQIFDIVVQALSDEGLMVILDNHRTRGDWCCDDDHGDGLWYDQGQAEAGWLRDWDFMARRYAGKTQVIGAELRNEIRPDNSLGLKPGWGDGVAATDWKGAAERAADVVSRANPDLLIIVGSIDYQTDLSVIARSPLRIAAHDKLVWAAHDYAWDREPRELADDAEFARRSFERFASLGVAGHAYSAPVYLSEWGACLQSDSNDKPCKDRDVAFRNAFARYLEATGIDFAYWPLNGDQLPGYKRRNGDVESYGLLRPDWSGYALPDFVTAITK